MKTQAQALLAAIQPDPATPVTPALATDAVLISPVDVTPLNAEYKERNIVQPFFGSRPKIVTGEHVQLSFEVEIAGYQGLGVPNDGLSTLLRICTLQETIVATTSVDYALAGGNYEIGTLYFYYDTLLHQVTNARGTVSASISANGIPSWKFTIFGLFSPVTDASVGNQVLTMYQQPVEVNSANTTVNLFGQSVQLVSCDIDLGVGTKFNDLPGGSKEIAITGRDVTGKITFMGHSVATYDWIGTVRSETTGALSLAHGPAGNRVSFAAPRIQLTNPSYGDRDGEMTMSLDMALLPTSAGNDEITIQVL